MSHFVEIDLQLREMEMLVRALRALGFEPVSHAMIRGYGGRQQVVDLAVPLRDSPYDVGFNQASDGTISVVAEWMGGHVSRIFGDANGTDNRARSLGNLLQAYALEVAKDELSATPGFILDEGSEVGTVRLYSAV